VRRDLGELRDDIRPQLLTYVRRQEIGIPLAPVRYLNKGEYVVTGLFELEPVGAA
jgi:hypothetical protein